MDTKKISELAEQGKGCAVQQEFDKSLAGKVDPIKLFQSYGKVVMQSREQPTLREPDKMPTAHLNAFIDFDQVNGYEKVSLVNEHDANPAQNRELSTVFIDSNSHKVAVKGCTDGPLEHQKSP